MIGLLLCHNTAMDPTLLRQSIEAVPPGRWAIGVSGGADSVALLLLVTARPNIHIHIVHLDHETRNGESGVDADFVADLAAKLKLPVTIQKRSIIESTFNHTLKNTPSRFRQARFALFKQVIEAENLQGVLLAHHADDQAETVLMRILRGAQAENTLGMRSYSTVRGIFICRPLLKIPGAWLRAFLQEHGQTWREDSSNRSGTYQRNRLRHWLATQGALSTPLLDLEWSSRPLRNWLKAAAPLLGETFLVAELNNLPLPLAKQAAGCWLANRGSPRSLISEKACIRLIEMTTDAASSPRQHFPGQLLVRRKQNVISAET